MLHSLGTYYGYGEEAEGLEIEVYWGFTVHL